MRLLLLALGLLCAPALVAGGGPANSGPQGATYTATYDPASLAAGTSRCDDVTVTGIQTGKTVIANIGTVDVAAGCAVTSVRVGSANTVRVCWRNAIDTITACDTATSTWSFSQP